MEGSDSYLQVEPVRPAAGYLGGKKSLAPRLVPMIEAMQHTTYCEPFVGLGGVFFRRRSAPRVEVINDRSGDIATFFRILQRHYLPFVEMLRWQVTSRREFERLKAADPATLTDLERAARFLYLQRTSFGGKVTGRTFGVDPRSAGAFDVTRVVPLLEALHERLAGVVIEHLDWADFIPRYDRPGTLFYCDPPYWGSERDYGPGFARADFRRLGEVLRDIQGHFILSLNDVPEVRELFSWATIESAAAARSVGGRDGRKPAREVIIQG